MNEYEISFHTNNNSFIHLQSYFPNFFFTRGDFNFEFDEIEHVLFFQNLIKLV